MSAPPTNLDRSLAAFRALVRSVFPTLRYFGRYRYSVHNATATTFDGVPVDASVAPALPVGVPFAPALIGSSCIPTQGTIAHVMFADGDPSQPVCVGFEQGGASATTAIDAGAINLGAAAGTLPRAGDTVLITGTVTGTTVSGVLTITSGTAQTPPAVSKVKA